MFFSLMVLAFILNRPIITGLIIISISFVIALPWLYKEF